MLRYRCTNCGKYFNPEKTEICPACGTAAAPSVLTRIERKQTAARLRAEGMTHYDDHCHEDDAWRGSYGAQAHRAAVQSHEANLRAGYRAHSAYDVTTTKAPPGIRTSRVSAVTNTQTDRSKPQVSPALALLRILLPLGIIFIAILFSILISIVGSQLP